MTGVGTSLSRLANIKLNWRSKMKPVIGKTSNALGMFRYRKGVAPI
jgi:hypothetical protein